MCKNNTTFKKIWGRDMEKDYAQAMMNPVKLRIMQQILEVGEIDAKQLAQEMPDIPISSLYRHLGDLTELGVLCISSETPMRGTVKKTYKMNTEFTQDSPTGEQLSNIIKSALCTIASEMQQYFEGDDVNVERDCIDLFNVVMHLSKQEYEAMREEMMQVMKKYMNHSPKEGSMARRMTLISSPIIVPEKEGNKNGNH